MKEEVSMPRLLLSFIFILLFTSPLLANNYATIDQRALNTPLDKETDLETLVSYLTEGLDKVEDKTRAIAAWIAYRVDFDNYKYKKYRESVDSNKKDFHIPDSKDAFISRKGISYDFADLFKRMATIAGIDSVIIKGYGKGYSLRNKDKVLRYWNAVDANGRWNLLDTSIGAYGNNLDENINTDGGYKLRLDRNIANPRKYYNEIRNASFRNKKLKSDDNWFFVKPQDMIKTHYPEKQEWQLIYPPVSPSSFFR